MSTLFLSLILTGSLALSTVSFQPAHVGPTLATTQAPNELATDCYWLANQVNKCLRDAALCEQKARETSSPSSAMVFSQQAQQFREQAARFQAMYDRYCR